VVVTRRPMLEAEAHERRKKALALLEPGRELGGVVRTIVDWAFPGNFPSGVPAGGLGVGAGGGVVLGSPESGLTVNPDQVGAFSFTVRIP
nr:hypothetical protein [Leptolyngbyaceae cyanobacterium MAG.088]